MTKPVVRNFAYNVGYQILKILTPLVTTPYVARVLGAELVGVFSYTQAVTNYFVMFAVLGMSTYGVRLIASASTREERSQEFWGAWLSQLGVCAVVGVAYVVMLFLAETNTTLWMCWGLWVASAAVDVSWLFFGCEDFGLTTARSAIVKLLGLVAIFTLVRGHDDLPIYILIVAGESFVGQVLLWPYLGRHVDRVCVCWKDVRLHFVPNLGLFIPVIATSLYNAMDTVLMGWLSTMKETAFYQYSYKVALIPLAVITALGTVMLPHMSRSLAKGERERGLELLETSLWVMLAMAFALTWGIVGVSEEFVPVFLGDEFSPCVPVVALLAWIIPFCSVTNVLGVQYLLPSHRDSQYTLSVWAGAAANIAVSLALIPTMGAVGSAWGSVVAQAAVFVAQCVFVRRELPLWKYARGAMPFLLIGAGMAVALRLAIAPFVTARLGVCAAALAVEVLAGASLFTIASVAWCVISGDARATNIARALIN